MTRLSSVCSLRALQFFGLFIVADIACAQSTNNQKGSLEEVNVIGKRLPVSPTSILPSIVMLLDEQLDGIRHSHVQESLNRIPGVNLQRGSGQEYLPAIRSPVLTGAGACGSFMISENNIPVRAAGFCNLNELFDAHTEQANRLEVLRGPGTVATGANALTGGVNTYLGTDIDSAVSIEVGSDQWRRAKARYTTSNENNRLAVYLTSTHDSGFRDSAGFDQHKFSLRHEKLLPQGTINSTLNSGLTVAYLDQQTAGFVVGENSYLDKDLSSGNANPEAFRESLAVRVWSSYRVQHDNGLEWAITPFARFTDMDFLLHFAPGTPLENNKQKSIGVQTALNWQPSQSLDIATGLDVDVAKGFLLETQSSLTSGSAFLQATVPAGVHYDYAVNAINIATHISAQWRIKNDWTLAVGSRLEHQHYDYDNRAVDGRTREDGTACGFGGCRFSRPADQSDDYTNASPRIELSRTLGANDRLFAIATTFARAPQATELYRLQRAQTVADLDSERTKSLELGYQWQSDKLHFDISLWEMRKTNVILRDSNFFNVADGATGHRGLEGSFAFSPVSNFEISGTLNFASHEYRNNAGAGDSESITGNEVDTAPGFFGDLRLLWNITQGSNLELQASKMGSYYLEPDNLFKYPGHALYHLRGQFRMSDQWRAFVRIINITDRRYADRADFTGFTGQRYFPGAPRSAFIGIEWRQSQQ